MNLKIDKIGDSMQIKIPEKVAILLKTLWEHGYEGYAVGGCVRDVVLRREPKDWDITTSAKPDQIKKLFRRTLDTGIKHGTVTVMMGREGYEVTTYRMDGEYEDHRHPKQVQFTGDLIEDLKRRDFTINAMAYDPKTGIVDEFDGIGDLGRKCIRCVGDPAERFEEDALRMLRGVRFAGQLQFTIEPKTLEAMRQKAPTLVNVSAERIRTELTKLLTSDGADRLLLAWETGLTKVFLPEFDDMLATTQNNPHHCFDVGHHSLETIRQVHELWKKESGLGEKQHIMLVYAALLHDVAKPDCKSVDSDGIDHFYGHNRLGAKKAKKILQRLKFDNDTISMVTKLIGEHDCRHENCWVDGQYSNQGAKAMRRLVNRIGKEAMPLLFLLQRADLLAQSDYTREEKLAKLSAGERCYREILEAEDPVSIRDLAIGGAEIMKLGVPAGPKIGEILNHLLEMVLEDPEKNCTETLVQEVKEQIKKV